MFGVDVVDGYRILSELRSFLFFYTSAFCQGLIMGLIGPALLESLILPFTRASMQTDLPGFPYSWRRNQFEGGYLFAVWCWYWT